MYVLKTYNLFSIYSTDGALFCREPRSISCATRVGDHLFVQSKRGVRGVWSLLWIRHLSLYIVTSLVFFYCLQSHSFLSFRSPCPSLWVGNVTTELTEKHLWDLFKMYDPSSIKYFILTEFMTLYSQHSTSLFKRKEFQPLWTVIWKNLIFNQGIYWLVG